MATNKEQKILNIFDLTAVIILSFLLFLAVFLFIQKPNKASGKVILTFKSLTPESDIIKNAALSQKEVYFNNVNNPVSVIGVKEEGNSLVISLEAYGSVAENRDIFNGQRVLVGQKAEIHGNYFAQGVITEIKNGN